MVSPITVAAPGRPATLADGIAYRPFGPMTALTYGNGLLRSGEFDLDYRPTRLGHGTVVDREYGYDTFDNITGITDHLDPGAAQGFLYDDLDRLTDADGAYGAIDYDYDATGNRTALIRDGQADSYHYQPGSHRLDSVSGANPRSFAYDPAGNAIQRGAATLSYDDRGRLAGSISGGLTTAYTYNALGQRVQKANAAATTRFVYAREGQLLLESGDGAPREYAWLNGRPLALFAGGAAPALDLNAFAVTGYDANQDVNGSATVSADGRAITLSGNTWKKIHVGYPVSADTVLEFTFDSASEAEIHGIGFDDDNAMALGRVFKLHGTQACCIAAHDDYAGGGAQLYRIPVGRYYSGALDYLFFANDHDVANPAGQGTFADIRIYENVADPAAATPAIDLGAYAFDSYDGANDVGGSVTVSAAGDSVTFAGNLWKKIDYPYTVTADTVLEFDFESPQQAEIHGIGLDDDTLKDPARIFKLHGSQPCCNSTFDTYPGSGVAHFTIPIGQYFTGAMNHLYFVTDHDVPAPSGEATLSACRWRWN